MLEVWLELASLHQTVYLRISSIAQEDAVLIA